MVSGATMPPTPALRVPVTTIALLFLEIDRAGRLREGGARQDESGGGAEQCEFLHDCESPEADMPSDMPAIASDILRFKNYRRTAQRILKPLRGVLTARKIGGKPPLPKLALAERRLVERAQLARVQLRRPRARSMLAASRCRSAGAG